MKLLFITLTTFIIQTFTMQSDFLAQQKRYKRVRKALEVKEQVVKTNLEKNGLTTSNVNILMVSYKEEQILELYAKSGKDKTYSKIRTYNICRSSGELGPKRKQGDYQVPEGFYYIDRFNPASNFYLSLGLNYPNKADKIKGTASNLGGDIFIHGSCVTIGCMPMTDDKMMEIYLYAVFAKNNGQSKIPVYSYPFKMTDEKTKKYTAFYSRHEHLIAFWDNLKIGYDKFMECNSELNFSVNSKGDYMFK